MAKFIINGGKKLNGTISVPTAKNTMLPILAGCVLVDGEVILKHYPKFTDVIKMTNIIEDLGADCTVIKSSLKVNADKISKYVITSEKASELRSSIFTLGALLGRFKKAKVAYPGGCAIGARPIDLHLKGLETLGCKIIEKHGYIYCDGGSMKGADVHLDFPSVGATENILMAACCINGITHIYNPAKEPEIIDLQNFLNKCGADIQGAGTDVITISGVNKLLHGCTYIPIGDRIIAGTYAIATAMTGGDVTIKNIDFRNILSLIYKLRQMGCQVYTKSKSIRVINDSRCNCINKIETMPFPGFPTDLQAQMMALQSVSNGTCILVENLFESRFKHVGELIKMGAKIMVQDRSALIVGVDKLYGADVYASDLRAGACLVIAGLVAEGYTTVNNIEYIDRGYLSLEKDLRLLGADIVRA